MKIHTIGPGISSGEVRDITHYFMTELKIGAELEIHSRSSARDYAAQFPHLQRMDSILANPAGYSVQQQFGVVKVVPDGSINGAEFLYEGMNKTFDDHVNDLRNIHKRVWLNTGTYGVDDTTGVHVHLLTVQKKPMAQLVLRNFLQLIKMWSPVLTRLSKTNNRTYGQFSKWGHLIGFSLNKDIQEYLGRGTTDRYGAINIAGLGYHSDDGGGSENRSSRLQEFTAQGALNGFHIELRFLDGNMSEYALAAYFMLFKAILLKAVAVSEYGTIAVNRSIGEPEWRWLKNAMRDADSAPPRNPTTNRLFEFMMRSLTDILNEIDGKSISVLNSLWEQNILEQFENSGEDYNRVGQMAFWEAVNKRLRTPNSRRTPIREHIKKVIVTDQIYETKKSEWLKKAVEMYDGPTDTITIERTTSRMGFRFNSDVGTYIRRL